MESRDLLPLLESNLSRQIGWIGAADAKTAFIFTIDTAMIALLAATAPAYGRWTPLGVAASIVAFLLLLASLSSLTAAVFPRTKGPKLSLIFFGAISCTPLDDFRAEMVSLDENTYVEDLIQQCHINAQIAAIKYGWIKRSSILLYLSLLPWVLATYVLFRDR